MAFDLEYKPPAAGVQHRVAVCSKQLPEQGGNGTSSSRQVNGKNSEILHRLRGNSDDSGCTARDWLALRPKERKLSLRLFADHSFLEAYWQGGRSVMTVAAPAALDVDSLHGSLTMELSTSSSPVTMRSVRAWHMGSIWVTTDQVRRAARARPSN